MSAYGDEYQNIEWTAKPRLKKVRVDYPSKRSYLAAPYIAGDYKPYACPITGKIIDGRKEHRDNLEAHGCRVHERGEFEDVKKNGKKRLEASMDAAIDKSVDAIARQIDF
jgi:predicted deacetylase